MKKSLLNYEICSYSLASKTENKSNFAITKLAITAIFFILAPTISFSQNNAITQLWQESNGVYSSKFGLPTVVDNSDNFYRAGFEKHAQGGTDVKLQKIDNEGSLV